MPPGVADLVTRAGGVVATALVVVAPCVMAAAVVVAVLAEACEEAEAAPTRYRYTIAYNLWIRNDLFRIRLRFFLCSGSESYPWYLGIFGNYFNNTFIELVGSGSRTDYFSFFNEYLLSIKKGNLVELNVFFTFTQSFCCFFQVEKISSGNFKK